MKKLNYILFFMLIVLAANRTGAQDVSVHSGTGWTSTYQTQTSSLWSQYVTPADEATWTGWQPTSLSPFSSTNCASLQGAGIQSNYYFGSTSGLMWMDNSTSLSPQGIGGNGGNPVYFRKHFNVTNTHFLTTASAWFKFWSDDKCEVYVNGTLVGSSDLQVLQNGQPMAFVSTSSIASLLKCGDNVIAIKAQNTSPNCFWVFLDMELYYDTHQPACSGVCSSWCEEGDGCTPNSYNGASITTAERFIQSKSGWWGYTTPTNADGSTNAYATIGSADLGNAPNNSNLYGLAVSNSSDRAFFGTRNYSSDVTDAVIAWGDNGYGNLNPDNSVDNMVFEFHSSSACGASTPVEIARMFPNGAMAVGTKSSSYWLSNGGSSASARFVVDMSNQGGNAGMLIKGNNVSSNWPTLGFSLNNNASPTSRAIVGASIVGRIKNATANSEAMELYFTTKSTSGTIAERMNITADGSVGIGITTPRTYTTGSGTVIGGGPASGTVSTLDVNGLVYGNSFVVSSDERFKQNIKSIENASDILKKLRGVTYEWNHEAFKDHNFDYLPQAGFIAQEVQKVYPVAVVKDENGYYAMNYNALLPLLAQAVKETTTKLDEVKKDNENLRAQLNDICNNGCAGLRNSSSTDATTTGNQLLQNIPNPFSQQTAIGYVINTGSTAFININALDGKLIKQLNITTKGAGSVTISGSDLSAGTYTYTLYVDDKVIDTKIMVISATK